MKIDNDSVKLEESYATIQKEHHQKYPYRILNMSVSEILEQAKSKDEKVYKNLESALEKFMLLKNEQPQGVMI